jgi:tRNA/tmRNA/rRNA uracil-C5-methylase (TrmA/RlmC/RlmD family)
MIRKQDLIKQHKKICKLLNVGHGDMQVRTHIHTSRYIGRKEAVEEGQRSFNEDGRRFFKLFQESTYEGSRAAARKMRKIAEREAKCNQIFLLFHSLDVLIRSESEMLSWPNKTVHFS